MKIQQMYATRPTLRMLVARLTIELQNVVTEISGRTRILPNIEDEKVGVLLRVCSGETKVPVGCNH